MCCAAILILTSLFAVTVSQVSIRTDQYNVKDDDSVVLTCTVPDFNENVAVVQNITSTIYNRAVCVANSPCISTNTSGYSVTKSGTDVIFTILSFSKASDVGSWFVRYGTLNESIPVTLSGYTESPTSQMRTSIATEKTKSVNSIFEFSNITIPMITDSITPTSDIPTLTTSYHYTGSTNFNAHTESTYFYSNTETTHFYTKTETTTSYANTETTNLNTNIETTNFYSNTEYVDANTEIIEIQTFTLRTVTTAANDISGSLDTTSQTMTETFTRPGYSIPSHNEITLPSTFVTSNVFPQTFSVTSISFSVDTLSDNSFHNLHVSSGSLNTKDSSKYSVLFMTVSPLISTTLIDQISYSLKMEDPSFSSNQYLSKTTVTLPKITVNSKSPSPIIDTMNHFLYTTNTLITSYLDDTSILFDDFTDGFQTFSQDYAAPASTYLAIFFNSTDHHLSLQTTEYYETMHTEFPSYVTTILYESHTDKAATGIYSKEIVTSGKSYMHTRVMPSQTRLASMNDIQDSTTDFQSTYLEPYSQSNNEFFSSEISEYLISTLQSTSLLLPFNAKTNASWLHSYMKPTHMSTFESQSGILTMDLSLITNPSSIQISTVLLDFKTTLLTSTINVNSNTMPSMIKRSSKQTNSGISYIEIETSFKDSLFSVESFSDSLTSNDQYMISLSSGVYKPKRTLSTNTIQSGLSEKNKTIIFITTISVVIAMIVVILLIVFAKVYMSKSKEHDNISWSNKSIPPKTAFPDYSFTGKNIYPLMNTSSVSFKMFRYEQHWNDIV